MKNAMKFSDFKRIILADMQRYPRNPKNRLLTAYRVHPGFRFTFWYRFAQFLMTRPSLKVLYRVVRWKYLRVQLATGIQIPILADIGEGLYIPHFGGIVVNPNFRAGKNLYLSHNVTIGKVHVGDRQGVPSVGEGVFLGTGTVLLGAINLGDNVAVGANSVVINHLPADAFAVGTPAKVVSNVGATGVLGG